MSAREHRNLAFEHLVKGGSVGPRTNDRHFPAKDIDQLWKLVDVGALQDCANPCHSRIISHRLYEFALVELLHRTKLEYFDGLVVVTMPRSTKQDGTGRVQLDGHCHDCEQRRQDHQACG